MFTNRLSPFGKLVVIERPMNFNPLICNTLMLSLPRSQFNYLPDRLKPVLLILLFCYGSSSAFGQAHVLDSLKSSANESIGKGSAFDLFYQIATIYYQQKEIDSGILYTEKAIGTSVKSGDKKANALAEYLYGKLLTGSLQPVDKATTHFIKSLRLFEEINDSTGMSDCHLQLGVINYSVQNFQDAADALIRSMETAPKVNPARSMIIYLLAICYSELGEYALADQMFRESLAKYAGTDNNRRLMVKTFQGKLLCNQGYYHQAIKFLENTLSLFDTVLSKDDLSPTYSFLSTAYLGVKDYRNCIRTGELAVKNVGSNSGVSYLIEAEGNLYKAYEAIGNISRAYYYLKHSEQIKDSLSGQSVLQRFEGMKAQYNYGQQLALERAAQELKEVIANEKLLRLQQLRNVFIWGFVLAIALAMIILRQRINIAKKKADTDKLLLNILPAEIAEELKSTGKAEARHYENANIIFTDFKEFTQSSEQMTASELVKEINVCFEAFDHICVKYNIEKIKTIGDSYMAASGLPVPSEDSTTNAVLATLEMADFILERAAKSTSDSIFFEMRVGIHTGPVVAGIVGVNKFQYDLWGDTVNTASRMESSGEVGKVNISQTTYELIKDDARFAFEYRGKVMAKGKGQVDMYFVERSDVFKVQDRGIAS